mgnify:CR=1 FL=1
MKFTYAMIGAAVASQESENFEFAKGMLMGSLDIDESYFINPKIKTCFYTCEDVLLDVVTGIRDLTSFDMEGLVNAIYSIGAGFFALEDVVKNCTPLGQAIETKQGGPSAYGDWAIEVILQNMNTQATIAQNPEDLQVSKEHLAVNGVEIYFDLLKAHADLAMGDFQASGVNVGHAAKKMTSGEISYAQMSAMYNAGELGI